MLLRDDTDPSGEAWATAEFRKVRGCGPAGVVYVVE